MTFRLSGTAWRLPGCGASGSRSAPVRGCPHAAHWGRPPAGPLPRACGFRGRSRKPWATNDLTRENYVPVLPPWITAGQTAWVALPRPAIGRFRYSPDGHIFPPQHGHKGRGFRHLSSLRQSHVPSLDLRLRQHSRRRSRAHRRARATFGSVVAGKSMASGVHRYRWPLGRQEAPGTRGRRVHGCL